MAFVLIVGEAGVGGGGLGAEMGRSGCASGGADSASEEAVGSSSSQEVVRDMGFERTLGAWAWGEMVSLSREDWRAEADADVEAIVAGVCSVPSSVWRLDKIR